MKKKPLTSEERERLEEYYIDMMVGPLKGRRRPYKERQFLFQDSSNPVTFSDEQLIQLTAEYVKKKEQEKAPE